MVMEILILIVATIAVIIVLIISYPHKPKKSDLASKGGESAFAERIGIEFPHAAIHIHALTQSVCVVDFGASKIMLGLGLERGSYDQPYRTDYDFAQIASVSVVRSYGVVASTIRSSQLTGLVLGGVALGGIAALIMGINLVSLGFCAVGSIVGGLSGSKRQSKHLNHLYLLIKIRDQVRPVHDISFFRCEAGEDGVPSHSETAKRAIYQAETFAAHIENAIQTSRESVTEVVSKLDISGRNVLHG